MIKNKRIIKINFTYYNEFTGEFLGGAYMPYDRMKAIRGFYSKWWKKWRLFISNEYGVEKRLVRLKIDLQY